MPDPSDRHCHALMYQMRALIDQSEATLDTQIDRVRRLLAGYTPIAGVDPDLTVMLRGLAGFLAGAIAFRAVLAEFGPDFTPALNTPAE